MKKILTLVAVAGIAGSAMADFNTGIQAGPIASNGAAGGATNGIFSFTYTGSSAATYNSIRVRGTATSTGIGSYLDELRWRFSGVSNIDSVQLASGQTWTGGRAIDNTQSFASFSMVNGTSYSFRMWESFDDAGTSVDANWSNIQFDFGGPPTPPVCTALGAYTAGAFNINTFGSGFDTELGLYSSTGALITNNDDAGGGLESQLTPVLANGLYYLAVGGYNTAFGAAGWSVGAGTDTGLVDLNINGYTAMVDQALASGQVQWYCFEVIPTPSTLALVGLGGLVATRRRR
jgi:hypothetical protein